jgi:hypothetical protein
MLNVAGPRFDFADVVHAVLADCEHRRRVTTDDLAAAAREKLQTIHAAYEDVRGNDDYWKALEQEVLTTALPRYVRVAERQNRLEQTNYGVWRGGDLAARAAFALLGLTVGGIIVAVPFIPIFIDAFAFALAFVGWFYPDLKRLQYDFRYTRELNAIVADAARYQATALQYLSSSQLDRMLT